MEQERETRRRQIIEEERLKLLKLHATKLLGYLPKVMTSHMLFISIHPLSIALNPFRVAWGGGLVTLGI